MALVRDSLRQVRLDRTREMVVVDLCHTGIGPMAGKVLVGEVLHKVTPEVNGLVPGMAVGLRTWIVVGSFLRGPSTQVKVVELKIAVSIGRSVAITHNTTSFHITKIHSPLPMHSRSLQALHLHSPMQLACWRNSLRRLFKLKVISTLVVQKSKGTVLTVWKAWTCHS
jgi:hypothetical protein